MKRDRPAPAQHVHPVRHAHVDFLCKHGRFLGEVEVTPDEVVAVDTLEGRTLHFQAAGRGTLRFYEVRISGREHVAAHGVPARFVTDFGTPDDRDAERRLEQIRGRKAAQG